MRNSKLLVALGVSGLVVAGSHSLGSEPPDRPDPSAIGVGKNLYKGYCASCHGKTGMGDGSLAEHLRTPPADLTELSKRNGNAIPSRPCRRSSMDGSRSRATAAPTCPHGAMRSRSRRVA